MEEWKDIIGYEGLYQVSSKGRVRSLYNNRYKILSLHKVGTTKHLKIGLYKNKHRKHFFVHRLVAIAFIPNPNNYLEVNHKDENPLNNNVNNLEWCNHLYNMKYGTCQKRSCDTHISRTPLILMFDKYGNLEHIYESVVQAEKDTGIPHSNIIACCKGRLKTAKGHIWKYFK